MPERPDLRRIAGDIREALSSYPREALVDILTYVFQAYVVEGAPAVHAPEPERLAELEGLGFAELVQALQLRFELPELSLFEVANGRVSVRLGGELHPIVLAADQRRAAQAPLPPPAATPPSQGRTTAPATPAATRAAAVATPASEEAPRPTRGLSVSSAPGTATAPRAPSGGSGAAPGSAGASPSGSASAPSAAPGVSRAPGAAPAAAPGAPRPAGGAAPASSDDPGEDDAASKRFRLLEID